MLTSAVSRRLCASSADSASVPVLAVFHALAFVAMVAVMHSVPIAVASSVLGEAANNPTVASATTAAGPYHWGFRGAGYHMQLEVEFQLHFESVRVSLDLPRAFFFDAAEVVQQYNIRALDGAVDITQQYTPLQFASTFPFDIEAPAFRVLYDTNGVNITFSRVSSSSSEERVFVQREGKGLLTLPIHARYEEVDATTPFSIGKFFNADSFVERCIPAVTVLGATTRRKTDAALNSNEGFFVSMERYETDVATSETGTVLPPNCRRIPVGMLSSLPFVYTAVATLQCAGAVFVMLSLFRK